MLAKRVGDNRVFAGLHYQEDVDHGKIAGLKLHDYIQLCPTYKKQTGGAPAGVLDLAQNEWA